ncbi:MAG: DNA replication/repair protein RecF [Mycoplasmatales bacterium]
MKLKKISLFNIRNHQELELLFTNNNLILGNNAVGKTTVAEIIYYCCFFKSFRTNNIYDLIQFDKKEAQIKLIYEDKNQENEIIVNFFNNKKKLFYNQQEVTNLYDILYKFNALIISPSNIDLINAAPAIRRNYLNMFIAQINQEFLKNLIKYKKLIKIKNKILKDYKQTGQIDKIYLNILNEELESLNLKIISKQNQVINNLNDKINDIIQDVTKKSESIKIKNLIIRENKTKEQIIQEELKYGQTLKGNHLNDLEFTLNNKLCKAYASQGQKRLISLSFFIAQSQIMYYEKGVKPLIIFDDVYLDLDLNRQIKLMNYIEKENQTIYITTNLEKMESLIQKQEKYNIINIV